MSLSTHMTFSAAPEGMTVTLNSIVPIIFPLPLPDPTQSALAIINNSSSVVWFALASPPSGLSGPSPVGLSAGPTVKGSIVLNPGQSLLLTSSAHAATWGAILSQQPGGTVDFCRGTASTTYNFNSYDDAVTV